MKYVKRPIVINAWPVSDLIRAASSDWSALPEEVRTAYEKGMFVFCSGKIIVATLEGNMEALNGDMLIQGINGEFYPCKPDIFEKTYEVFDEAMGR